MHIVHTFFILSLVATEISFATTVIYSKKHWEYVKRNLMLIQSLHLTSRGYLKVSIPYLAIYKPLDMAFKLEVRCS